MLVVGKGENKAQNSVKIHQFSSPQLARYRGAGRVSEKTC